MIEARIDEISVQNALKDIKKYEQQVQTEVKGIIDATAFSVARKAKAAAPFGRQKVMTGKDKRKRKRYVSVGGSLRASIKAITYHNRMEATAGTGVHYAPYVEFGTGTMVKVPAGLEDYAMQFKGQGIRQVNLPARPFLFPAMESERKPYIEKIKKALERGPKR